MEARRHSGRQRPRRRAAAQSPGGTVAGASMHSDRKAAAHIARAAGVPVLDYRRSPEHFNSLPRWTTCSALTGCCTTDTSPKNIASVGHSVGGNLAVSLALGLRDEGAALPGAIADFPLGRTWTLTNETITSNADRDSCRRVRYELFRRGLMEPWTGRTRG